MLDHHDHSQADTKALFRQAALECAGAPVVAGVRTICGDAVIHISAYAQTLRIRLSEPERLAIIGQAFDIFAAAVRREQS